MQTSSLPVHDGSLFSWGCKHDDKAGGSYVSGVDGSVDVSSLGNTPWTNGGMFCIRSHRTGKTLTFKALDTVRNAEGEINSWLFSSWDEKVMVAIFND